jgi:hypothetical protein
MHLAAVLLSAFALGSQQCTARQIGPGQHVEGGTRGAACLLAAFREGCRPARYVLTGIGISTYAVENFSVERWSGRCAVLVISSVTVVVGKPQVVGPRLCTGLHRLGADVVADRCRQGPTSVSLTRFA